MIKNFVKTAIRNLLRNKAFSLINISGLAVGMASAVLIILWIVNEVSYDRFHEKKDRIYEAWNRQEMNGETESWNATPKVLAKALQADFPEVEQTVRSNYIGSVLLSAGDKYLKATGDFTDSNFFQVFSLPLVSGNVQTALNEMHNIVVTESLAKKLFGKEEAIGKVVRLNNEDHFTVSGVAKDLPNNTRFDFEFLLPWSYLKTIGGDDELWGNNSIRTYVLLKPSASLSSLEPKLKTLRSRYDKADSEGGFFLYPASRWRLFSNFQNGVEEGGRITVVRLFGMVAAFILLIACINFMNLSTARSEKRAKEVGIRKVVGAQKKTLVGQFIGESVLLSMVAGCIALAIVQLSLPAFNSLTDKNLWIDYSSPVFWICAVGFILFTGLLAGSYPAFFLSAMQPVRVLKGGSAPSKAGVSPRKVLVVLQFSFAIILIIATIVVRQQIAYAQNRATGYNKNNLVYHELSTDLKKNYQLVKNELLSSGAAVSVSKTSAKLTEQWSNSWGFEWSGKDPNDKTPFERIIADDAIVATAGLQLLQGRDFDLAKYPTDSTAMLLNETAVQKMNFKEPIGQIVKDIGIDWHVIGVVKDFIQQSPFQPVEPLVIEGAAFGTNGMHIRLHPANSTGNNLRTAEAIFKKYNPSFPFEYQFIDEEYAEKFHDEKRTAALATLFALLTIFISCLGLFGLVSFMAENRTKEIGIRKVLGASVTSITTLLSKDFVKLVLIALAIATPVAWWAMSKWLENYQYRIQISGWVFAFAGIMSVFIAIATVSIQAARAALANPVKSLKNE